MSSSTPTSNTVLQKVETLLFIKRTLTFPCTLDRCESSLMPRIISHGMGENGGDKRKNV